MRTLRRRVHAMEQTVQMDLARTLPAGDNAALLALSEAAHARQRMHLRYADADGAAASYLDYLGAFAEHAARATLGIGLVLAGIAAFDVNQTCLSFVTALDVAAMGFAAGRWRRPCAASWRRAASAAPSAAT